jgi:hypothetical protein
MAVFQNNIPEFEHLDGIDVKFAESCVGSGGYHYVFLKTKTRIRPAQLKYAINSYNEQVPDSKTAVLIRLPRYESVITFKKKAGEYTKHLLYKLISNEKVKNRYQLPSTYKAWEEIKQTKKVHLNKSSELYDFNVKTKKMHLEESSELLDFNVETKKMHLEESGELFEFDVVKKQQAINAANEMVGSDITEVLLGEGAEYFYNFSNAVMDALTTVSRYEADVVEQETRWMQEDHQCKTKTRIGYAYAAVNTCLGDPAPVKMGATMRDSPFFRLKELSKCLPQSFELLACVPSKDPFAVEKHVHAHFDQFRIKRQSTGRNTEFFMVSKETVCEYFANLNQELLLPA